MDSKTVFITQQTNGCCDLYKPQAFGNFVRTNLRGCIMEVLLVILAYAVTGVVATCLLLKGLFRIAEWIL
jgi:hypothetical protein